MSQTVRSNSSVSPADNEELQELVFDLVRERVLAAIGVGGMWSIDFRKAGDTDAFFGETVAERIARDVAAQIAPQSAELADSAPVLGSYYVAPAVSPSVASTVSADVEQSTGEPAFSNENPAPVTGSVERVVWVAEPSQVAWVAEFAEARTSDRAAAATAETEAEAERAHRRLVA
ncbi:hypothetical protein [Lacisediminihabitans profunda]|uniref:Uncharacterized protein n=1 Tax=Lacisediminihabitans profunda TaxID=2594790 RepID=A0A5C8UML2_9MICO|nr:hypothetical protein [Lacisediminihabitans profunda]TXN28720.1 hypothetical protein FVP33_16100 [Lacisediminihabitans profunda]